MKGIYSILMVFLLAQCSPAPERIFDGQTFHGWEGDTTNTWRIEDGAIVGGSLQQTIPHNQFLCTQKPYSDFVLRLKFKLTGTDGFVNAGVQFRSQRTDEPAYEMIGYQADLGEGFWGCLYDESRRKKVLVSPDSVTLAKALLPDGWNQYEIRANGRRIRTYINGVEMIDYTEPDDSIPQTGLIGLQIHGGGKALVYYKDITIETL